MKKIFLPLLAIILFSCSSKQKDNSLKQWNLKGRVKSIRNQSYDAKLEYGDEIIKTGRSYTNNYDIKFDENGFMTEKITYNDEENIRAKDLFTYKDDKLITMKTYGEDGELRSIQTNYYDNGALSKMTITDKNGDIEKTYQLKSNKEGQIFEGVELNGKGLKSDSWKNEFSGDKVTKYTRYDSSGTVKATIIYEWNAKNDRQKIDYRSKDHSFIEKFKYKYDDKENWILCEVFNENDSLKRIEERFINYHGTSSSNNISTTQLIGFWEEKGSDNWIEFRQSGKYKWGANNEIEDKGSYEYNKKQSVISFISDKDNSKKFRIEFTEGKLIFRSVNGSEEKIFVKYR